MKNFEILKNIALNAIGYCDAFIDSSMSENELFYAEHALSEAYFKFEKEASKLNFTEEEIDNFWNEYSDELKYE
jgi:hypothetical protein